MPKWNNNKPYECSLETLTGKTFAKNKFYFTYIYVFYVYLRISHSSLFSVTRVEGEEMCF